MTTISRQNPFHVISFKADGDTLSGRVQSYKPRRTHYKSSRGCFICKRRRIKCDEQSPSCQNCIKHGTRCKYNDASPTPPRIGQGVQLKLETDWSPDVDSRLLDYFVDMVAASMMPLSSWAMASRNFVGIAISEPHVMHSMLAVSASHYRYHLKSPQKACTSETFHSVQACSGLRRSLDVARADQIDAAITSSIFLAYASFADTVEDYRRPLTSRRVPFSWFGSQLGLASLFTLLQSRVGVQSMWVRMFDEVADLVAQVDDSRPGIDDIPPDLVTLFGVAEPSTCEDHDYLRILRRLCRLLPIDPGSEASLLQYMQFVERLSPRFVNLLNVLDARALMLLSYWLSLLLDKNCWWSRRRAKNECRAICEHLEKYGDPEVWRYMDYPAAACGYPYSGVGAVGRRLVERFRAGHRDRRGTTDKLRLEGLP